MPGDSPMTPREGKFDLAAYDRYFEAKLFQAEEDTDEEEVSDLEEDYSGDESESDDEAPPPRKRAKRAPERRRGRRSGGFERGRRRVVLGILAGHGVALPAFVARSMRACTAARLSRCCLAGSGRRCAPLRTALSRAALSRNVGRAG